MLDDIVENFKASLRTQLPSRSLFLLLAFRAVTGGTDDCDCVMTVGIAARRESCDGGGVISVEIGRLFFLVGDDVVFVGDDTGMGRGW